MLDVIDTRLLPCCSGCFKSRGGMLINGASDASTLGITNASGTGGTVAVVSGNVGSDSSDYNGALSC